MKKSFDFEGIVCTVALFIMLAIVFINVLSRYVFHMSISYLEEIVCVLFVLLTTVGAAAAQKIEGHFSFDLLQNVFKPKTGNFIAAITNFLTFLLALTITITGVQMVIEQYKMGALSYSLEFPEWIYGLTVPFGMALMSIRSIQVVYRRIGAWKDGEN